MFHSTLRSTGKQCLWLPQRAPSTSMWSKQVGALTLLVMDLWQQPQLPLSSCGRCCRRAGYKAFMEQQQRRGANFVTAAKQKSYQLAPRATIFRRDAGSVTDLASLKRLMRSNSFRTDPVGSAGLPCCHCTYTQCKHAVRAGSNGLVLFHAVDAHHEGWSNGFHLSQSFC